MENTNSNLVGLTDSEVQKRIDEGKVNISTNIKTKSIKRIFCDNLFTLFNLINVILLAALIFVGSHKNMLFIGVVIANIIIGIVQEIRSKISVDKLTILSEKKINVLRNGKIVEISKEDVQYNIQHQADRIYRMTEIKPVILAEHSNQRCTDASTDICTCKGNNHLRNRHQGRCENDRNNTSGVDL